MPNPPLKQPSLARRLLSGIHNVQRSAGRLAKAPTSGMRTDVFANGKPVLFIHNPRAGGRSLEKLFNVKRLSHAFPVDRLTERQWCDHFIVTSVRNPLDRFFSGYYGFVKAPGKNSLVKLYGWGVKSLTPLEYLNLIKKHPRHIGSQLQWTDFPSKAKPRADLVLRLEDVADWERLLIEAGVEIGDRHIPHIGKSGNKTGVDAEGLGISEDDFKVLRRQVEDHFTADYDAYGYSRTT